MNFTKNAPLLLLVVALLFLTKKAFGISYQHTVNESQHLNLGANINVIVKFRGCTGTLISHNKILTAAHCLDVDVDGVIDTNPAGETVYFGANSFSPSQTAMVVNAAVHPLRNRDTDRAYDIAVLTLNRSIVNITPAQIAATELVGKTAMVVGYGKHGTGNNFSGARDGRRRAATNVIDAFDLTTGTYRLDFDSPDGRNSTYGSSTPLALEGSPATGDSGGPLLVDLGDGKGYQVAGVMHGGRNPSSNTDDLGPYGSITLYSPVSYEATVDFLNAQGIGINGRSRLPNPDDEDGLVGTATADIIGESIDVGGDWRFVDWFGYFNSASSANGWIYHETMGWLFTTPSARVDDNFWVWSPDLGWLWTSSDDFPFVFQQERNRWLWHDPDGSTQSTGWFLNVETDVWTKTNL